MMRAGLSPVNGLLLKLIETGSLAFYGLALYAMTKAPIAAVAAWRETSIFFALLISVSILKEKASPWRYVAGGLIAAGALTMKPG